MTDIPPGNGKILGESIVQNTVLPTAMRVIRLHELPTFLGVRKSQISEAIRAGLLHPFTVIPGGRSKVVTEAEVISLQQRAIAEAAAAAEAANAEAAKPVPIEVKPATPAPVGRKRKPATAERALTD